MYRTLLILAVTVCVLFSPRTGPVYGKFIPLLPGIDLPELEARLHANKGKVIILEFWMHNCPNCLKEAPFMSKMYRKYKGRGLLVIGLSVDEDYEDAWEFVLLTGIRYPTFMANKSILDAFGVKSVPYHVYIDRKGGIRGQDVGFYSDKKKEIEKRIIELLKESS